MQPPRPRLVLVVEDNVDAQLITTATLRHFGFDVIQADGLEQARGLARERRPDAVVLDCRLPDGDGLELARAWRTDPTMKDVPVIVLTAFSARQDVEAALLAGADAFLVKPIPGAVLAAQVEKLLAGARPSQTLRVRRP
ncbi:MAG: response regulator [Labilithrix sp.]|nr:response regulator [Labilithrix sp.]MBX3221140.1 response regulator [Labilithrix sp.]